MSPGKMLRNQVAPWIACLILAPLAGWAAIEFQRWILEQQYRQTLALEAKHRAVEITAQALNGDIMGAVRLPMERIDTILHDWTAGPALLLSPQDVSFASNRPGWNMRLAGEHSAEQIAAIRAQRQFGERFNTARPPRLPIELTGSDTEFEGTRYAIARARVEWNDANGAWTLALLGDLGKVMSPARRNTTGAITFGLTVLGSLLFLRSRRRLQIANHQRLQAENELTDYAQQQKSEAHIKARLLAVSRDLQRCTGLSEFGLTLMAHLTANLHVELGVFYVFDAEKQRLLPVAGHAVELTSLAEAGIDEGLLGQCARDHTPIVITDPGATSLRIVWGEGEISPQMLQLLPLVQGPRLLGVVLLASLREPDTAKRAMQEEILGAAAMGLEILDRNLATQRQAQALIDQQLRQQETESWYCSIIEAAPDGMMVVDETGKIILANAQLHELFGYAPGDLIDKSIEILVPQAIRAQHPTLREGYMKTGKVRRMGGLDKELMAVRRDGSLFPVEVGLAHLPSISGRGNCACASVRDISVRRANERSMREALTHLGKGE